MELQGLVVSDSKNKASYYSLMADSTQDQAVASSSLDDLPSADLPLKHDDSKTNSHKERVTWAGPENKSKHHRNERPSFQTPIGINGDRTHSDTVRNHREYVPGGSMYVLYEGETDEAYRSRRAHSTKGSSSSMCFDNSYQWAHSNSQDSRARDTNNVYNREIDGRFSFSHREEDDEFVRIEDINTGTGMSTSKELLKCKKTVLKPYHIFLKVIGWRRIQESHIKTHRNCCIRMFNIFYPLLIFVMLLLTVITQILTCFNRTLPGRYPRNSTEEFIFIECSNNLILGTVIPGVLILVAYLYGVYIFRYGVVEHIPALMETVFLSYHPQSVKTKTKTIIKVLWAMLAFVVVGFLFDFCLNVLRLLSLKLLDDKSFFVFLSARNRTQIEFDLYNGRNNHTDVEDQLRYPLVFFSLFGLCFFDILYIATIFTYASQNQLIQYYINSIIDKVEAKAYSLDDAIKEIHHTYSYLQVINSQVATLTTLIMFVIADTVLCSVYNLIKFNPPVGSIKYNEYLIFGAVVGLLNILQWTVIVAIPLIQAARLTSTCRQLRRLGVEIGHRPYVYANTPQLELISFVQYVDTTRYTAKLAKIPIHPSNVIGLLFIGGVVVCFVLLTEGNGFVSYPWI